jgi:hypothetical protein
MPPPGTGLKGKGREMPMSTLRRRETNVTPAGRHPPINNNNAHLRPHPYARDGPASVPVKSSSKTKPLQSRKSLTFLDPARRAAKPAKGRASDLDVDVDNDDDDGAVARAQIRLAQFR